MKATELMKLPMEERRVIMEQQAKGLVEAGYLSTHPENMSMKTGNVDISEPIAERLLDGTIEMYIETFESFLTEIKLGQPNWKILLDIVKQQQAELASVKAEYIKFLKAPELRIGMEKILIIELEKLISKLEGK